MKRVDGKMTRKEIKNFAPRRRVWEGEVRGNRARKRRGRRSKRGRITKAVAAIPICSQANLRIVAGRWAQILA